MREIKFRGKNANTKQWIYGDLLHKGGKTYIGYWVKDDDSPSGDGYIECEVLPETIGQYTGTQDKNSNEIYKDDIVKEQNMISVCMFLDNIGAYAFIPVELYRKNRNNLYSYSVFHLIYNLFEEYGTDCFFDNDVPHKYIEKLGNVFDNLELLKDGSHE